MFFFGFRGPQARSYTTLGVLPFSAVALFSVTAITEPLLPASLASREAVMSPVHSLVDACSNCRIPIAGIAGRTL